MLDRLRAHITDLRHANRDETDVIMTKIREECGFGAAGGGSDFV